MSFGSYLDLCCLAPSRTVVPIDSLQWPHQYYTGEQIVWLCRRLASPGQELAMVVVKGAGRLGEI